MTLLTPTFSERQANGAAGPHIIAAHEPTKEGENPPLANTPVAPQGVPAVLPTPLKVALIGTAPSSRMLAPYNDPSWQIWGCSPGNMNSLPRVNLWFELHSNLLWPEHESYGKPYIEWLKQQKFPVLMQALWPTLEGTMVPVQTVVPNATAFPRDELVAEFGCDFFTSSFAWMMAYAMKAGASEIALYGIDMASRDEYIRQRPGFFFFRHMARQRGIKVSAPHESDIMQSPALYAYVDSTPFGRKIMARRKEVSDRISGAEQQLGQLNNTKTYLSGALEDLDYFESIWSGVSNEIGQLEFEIKRMTAQMMERDTEIVRLRGLFASQPVLAMPMEAKAPRRRKTAEPAAEKVDEQPVHT